MTGMNLVAVVTAALTAFFQSITSCCCWLTCRRQIGEGLHQPWSRLGIADIDRVIGQYAVMLGRMTR